MNQFTLPACLLLISAVLMLIQTRMNSEKRPAKFGRIPRSTWFVLAVVVVWPFAMLAFAALLVNELHSTPLVETIRQRLKLERVEPAVTAAVAKS